MSAFAVVSCPATKNALVRPINSSSLRTSPLSPSRLEQDGEHVVAVAAALAFLLDDVAHLAIQFTNQGEEAMEGQTREVKGE